MSVTDHPTANMAMMEVLFSARGRLADNARLLTALQDTVASPIVAESEANFSELVYANREQFEGDELTNAADVAAFAGQMGFYGLAIDLRGHRIAQVLRGEEIAEEDQPQPVDRFVMPLVEEPVPPPPVPGEE